MCFLELDAAEVDRHPDALTGIFAGRLTGMVIRGAFPREALAAVVGRLEHGDFGLQSQRSAQFQGESYGRVLITEDRDLGVYFHEAARFRAACAELFAGGPDFQARVEELLTAVAGGRTVRVPMGGDDRPYAPATIRGLRAGGQIDLHCENETVDFPSMWHLSRLIHARNQLSYYVMLGPAESGGELVVHNARHAEGPGALLARMERSGPAVLQALSAYGQVVPHTDVGDLLVFDSGRYFHRVTAVTGEKVRWTMGGFLARSLDERVVYYWS